MTLCSLHMTTPEINNDTQDGLDNLMVMLLVNIEK